MASGLPNSTKTSEVSLSHYFNQADQSDSIFDTISKAPMPDNISSSRTDVTVNFFQNSATSQSNQESKEPATEVHKEPTISFKKSEADEEPKIFSYFSQPSTNIQPSQNTDASEFFDQISQNTSTTHELTVTTTPVTSEKDANFQQKITQLESNIESFSSIPQPLAVPYSDISNSVQKIPSNNADPSTLPNPILVKPPIYLPNANVFVPVTTSNIPEESWNEMQEQASFWWIPEENTQKMLKENLQAMITSHDFQPITPRLSDCNELADPIQGLLRHFDGEGAAANRRPLTADLVSQDDNGIRDLIKAGCWRAAINLCGRLITSYGQGYGKTTQPVKHTPHSLQLWFTRLALLVKTQLADVAATEIKAFRNLDSPDLYYEFYPELNGQKKGTMVPFSFRLLAAEIPAHNNDLNESQDKLCQLLVTVRKIIKRMDQFFEAGVSAEDRLEAVKLWSQREVRVMNSLMNCALMKKDFHNAVSLLQQQLLRPDVAKAELYSTMGRIYLQLGDVQRGQQAFNSAAKLRNNSLSKDVVTSLIDAGLVAIAQNAFTEAYSYYQQALHLEPNNALLVNNTAVCLLYMGRMQESMLLLEENLGTKPDAMINNPTVLNVCTLYELESSLTTQRKLGMLRLASQWRNDNLNDKSFKLAS